MAGDEATSWVHVGSHTPTDRPHTTGDPRVLLAHHGVRGHGFTTHFPRTLKGAVTPARAGGWFHKHSGRPAHLSEEQIVDTSLIEARRPPTAHGTPAIPDIGSMDDAASMFTQARPSLLHIAHRIVGSPAEAEDIVQEVWLRLQRTDRAAVQNPSALLRTITARLAMNVVQSARRRREFSASTWFPESADLDATPEAVAERQDAVERAVALLLATLTPKQRAAYMLREGFGYSYDRIASLLQLSIVNSRQQVTRAQQRLGTRHQRQEVDAVMHRSLVQAFLGAARTGDLTHLERILLADAN